MKFAKNYTQEAPYISENKIYLMNGFTSGLFSDIWNILEHHLNFSTLLFKDEKHIWGNAIELPNGTIITTGIADDLSKKKVDVVIAPISMTPLRRQFFAYLPPIQDEMIGIVIPNSAVVESFDFQLFFKPLHIYLWISIIVTIIIVSIIMSLATRNGNIYLWSSFKIMFGGTPKEYVSDRGSKRIVVLTALITSVIIWTSYNASFTSELASVVEIYPFVDLESLAMSDWRYSSKYYKIKSFNIDFTSCFRLYTQSSKSGVLGSLFQDPKSPKYHELYKNNMNEDSFVKLNKGLDAVVHNPKSAMMYWIELMKASSQYQDCRIKLIPWKQPLGSMSVGLQKLSPYEPFMKQVIMDIYAKGILKKLQQKYSLTPPQCETKDIKPISLEKIVVCFVWIVFGIMASMITLVLECFVGKCKERPKPLAKEMKKAVKENFKGFVEELTQLEYISIDELVTILRNIKENTTIKKRHS